MSTKPKLGDLLVEANLIDEVQLKIALEEQKRWGTKFGSTLLALHFVDENVLTAFLSRQLDMPCVSLNSLEIPSRVLKSFTRLQALQFHAVPVRLQEGTLHVAMVDPLDVDVIEQIEEETALRVSPMVAPQSSIAEAIERLYPDPAREEEGAGAAGAGAFPELAREVEALDGLGAYFTGVNDRLDQMNKILEEISAHLARLEAANKV